MVNAKSMKDQVTYTHDVRLGARARPVNWAFLTTTPDQPEDTTRRLA